MSLGNVNGAEIKSQINSIKTSGDCGSRKGRIEVLEQVSALGKEILDALNEKDENLVEIEGDYDDILAEVEEFDAKIEEAEGQAKGITGDIEGIDEEIAAFEERIANGEELSEFDQARLEYLYQSRSNRQSDADNTNSSLDELTQQRSGSSAKLDKYNALLSELTETMDDYADAGDEVRQAAHDVGRPGMADNIEKNGGAIKRNESMWGREFIYGAGGAAIGGLFGPVGGTVASTKLGVVGAAGSKLIKNDTEKYVERMGWTGMEDGGEGYNMTYHDDENGGYHAAYDVKQYGIGGKLRQLTAQTLSYGKTVNTAANDMKQRAEELDGKRKLPEEDEGVNGGDSAGTA